MSRTLPVVVAGGSGTRLWPYSREAFPKQFLSLGEAPSFFQQVLLRLKQAPAGVNFESPCVVSNDSHRFLIREQAEACWVTLSRVILEPAGRNTAPALTAAALLAADPSDVLLMLPADHHIGDAEAFVACLARACTEAARGCIATVGVTPIRPDTGFGYIRATGAGEARRVDRFVEKPDRPTAEAYLQSGDYLWNAGVFAVQAATWLNAIARFRPDIESACRQAVVAGKEDGLFFRLDEKAFSACPSDSIDYAVMERAVGEEGFECVVVPYAGSWSDLGSWHALWDAGEKDAGGNVRNGDVLAENTRNSILMSQSRLLTVFGCENLVVAETADAVLVADRGASQSLSEFVKLLKRDSRPETLAHTLVHRPWGSFESILSSENYQVKRLTLKPGKKISLQTHKRRSEHWVVVSGTATVTRGEETVTLKRNESTYIPRGVKHRMANDGSEELEVIEVQTGDYLGEDDIVRYEDDFGRTGSSD